ncbi:Uncharacterized protein Rs2_27209 [Raphanus sativus]|nr:Uncharacterized protein Rs2_27209 [Raphanus sativus]
MVTPQFPSSQICKYKQVEITMDIENQGGGGFYNSSDKKTDKDISADSTTFVLTEEEYCEEILLEKEILLAKLRDDEERANCAASGETLKAEPEKKGGRGRKKGCYSGRQSEG